MLRKSTLWAPLCMLAMLTSWSVADDEKTVVTNVADAGEDYQVQGEYSGSFNLGDSVEQKFGLQVVALGDGKFKGVAYVGGLPGDDWDGFTTLQVEGERDGEGVITLIANEGSAEIKDGMVTVRGTDGTELGQLKRVERKSPTLGEKPPAGAVVLFDGTTADKFDGGELTDEGWLKAGCKSKDTFGDCQIHLEFRTPFMPDSTGQGRGNSGLYIQDRYELQVLDSFGCEGLNNECGGFYTLRAPIENMCFPPLVWQTYDIDFTAAKFDADGNKTDNARVTVRHNGVVIHENVELVKETPGGQPESAAPGPLQLQDHNDPVVYRNVWVLKK